ncbi:glycosyltransferase family 39 protein [Candidatus Woesearchaeota archaeon]|nr:glycosyltransferase family 39 protein [Candidatus Woesearchaeota archaeon]
MKLPEIIKKIVENSKIALPLIVLLGLILRIIFFSGMGTSDDLLYSRFAHYLDKGVYLDADLSLSTRLGIIFLTAISYSLFGINDFSSVFFVLASSLAGIVLVYYFGKLIFDKKTGLIAAFLLSIFPLDIVYSTRLLTDVPSAFLMNLGVYIFLYNELKMKWRFGSGYLLSGIFIGLGYMIRETILLIGIFFVFYSVYRKKIKKEYLLVAFGFLMIFAIESSIFYGLTGYPLFRQHASQQALEYSFVMHDYFGRLEFPKGLLHYPYIILTGNSPLFYILIFISIIHFMLQKNKEAYLMLIWFIPLLLYLSFGTTSLTSYIPLRAVERYLTIISVPGLLLLALFLNQNKGIRGFMPFFLLLLLISSVFFISLRQDKNSLASLRILYNDLQSADKAIYADERTIKVFDYISAYNNKLKLIEYPKNFKDVKDAYVIVNKKMLRNVVIANPWLKFPEEIENPPKNWKITKQVGKEEKDMILVYHIL